MYDYVMRGACNVRIQQSIIDKHFEEGFELYIVRVYAAAHVITSHHRNGMAWWTTRVIPQDMNK